MCLATIRHPVATQINVRTGPGTNHEIKFKGQVGLRNLRVLKVKIDNEGKSLNDKTYQWFHLQFPDSTNGWIRDDLLDIQGDCDGFGYGNLQTDRYAFELERTTPIIEPPQPPDGPTCRYSQHCAGAKGSNCGDSGV